MIDGSEWSRYRLIEHITRLQATIDDCDTELVSDEDKEKVHQYLAKCADPDAIRVDDSTALTVLLRLRRPFVLIATIG